MKVGKLSLYALVMAMLLMSAMSARADQITLGAPSKPSTQPLTFTGEGKSKATQLSLALGKCNASTFACVLSGMGFGDGTLASGPAPYSLSSTLGTLGLTLTGSSAGESQWSVQQTKPILFEYGTNGSLLKGDLTLISFQETGKSGVFNYNEDINLAVTGGSLASAFGSQGTADLTIVFTTNTNIQSLLGGTKSITGTISSGQVVPLPTPEPGSASTVFTALVMMAVGDTILRGRRSSSQRTR